jgi:hypothetical protein
VIGEEGEECTIEKGGRILGDDCSSVDYVLEVSDARSVKFFKLHRFNLLIQGGLALYLLNQPCFALILNFSSLLRHIFLRIIMFLEENFLCKSNVRRCLPILVIRRTGGTLACTSYSNKKVSIISLFMNYSNKVQ